MSCSRCHPFSVAYLKSAVYNRRFEETMESAAVIGLIVVLIIIIIAVLTRRLALLGLVAVAGVVLVHAVLVQALVRAPVVSFETAPTRGQPMLVPFLGTAETGKYGGAAAPFDLDDFEHAAATVYSSPRADQILQEIFYFRHLVCEEPVNRVIDATAHVGVDTAVLAYAFPDANITAVERVLKTSQIHARNMKKLGFADRVSTIHGSADEYLADTPPADLVYLDPPWGGPGYGKMSDIPLSGKADIDTIPLAPVINAALKVAPVVVLKAPHDFDYQKFEQGIDGHVVSIARIKYPEAKARGKFRPKRAVFILLEIRKTARRES